MLQVEMIYLSLVAAIIAMIVATFLITLKRLHD
jgi:hypothetical protein